MILKLIGSSIVIFSSFLIGYSKTIKLKEEVQIVNLFITFFNYAKADILTTRLTFEQIINNFCLHNHPKYISILKYYLKNSNLKSFEAKNLYQIDDDVHRIVLNLFNAIAYSSITEIEKLINDGIRQLHENYERIKERYNKNARVFSLVGIFCGTSICIILF